MSISNYAEKLLLDYALSTTAVVRPTAWYVQLHTTDPTDTGTADTPPTVISGDYARKTLGATGMSPAVIGATTTSSNPAVISWTADATAATYTITYVSIWDAVTAGNMLFSGALALPETVVAGGVITLSIGKLVAALD